MCGSSAAKSYGSGGSTCRVSVAAARCSFTCAIASIPVKFGCQTPHCATQFPPYLGSAVVRSCSSVGGAGGRVSAALAALSGRDYVDRPTVLLQFRAGAVHGGGGSRGQKYRDAETPAARAALVPRRCDCDVLHRSR